MRTKRITYTTDAWIMNKLVTVIVPTIGRPNYIKSTIDSILMQDYREIEVLVSDNFPEVSTRLILGKSLDSRIRIIERERRHEFSEHMNLCIHDARGWYVMILSDDDLISPDYVSSMVGLFSESEDVKVGLGRQKVLSEIDVNLNAVERGFESTLLDGVGFTLDHFLGKQHFPICTYLSLFAKKRDVLAAGGFHAYPDGSNADNFLFYSLALKGKVGVSNGLMGYRVYLSSSGLSTPFEKLYLATLEYDKDISRLVWGLVNLSFPNKLHLRLLIKISSSRMMKYRLLTIYKTKIGGLLTAIKLTKVLVNFLPRNIFYGVGGFNKK